MFWIVVVQLLSHVKIFVTLWTATCQASMSFTNSYSLQFAQTRAHWVGDAISSLLLLLPSIFPSIKVFPISWLFTSGGQSVGASASATVLPVNIQDWIPLGLTGLISLQARQGQTQDCLITEPRQLCSTGMPLLTTMLYCIGFVFKGNTSRYGLTAKIHSNNIITFSQAYLVFMTC